MDSARAVVAQEGDLIERLLALAGQICAVGRVTVGQVGGVFTMGKLPMMGWITEERHYPVLAVILDWHTIFAQVACHCLAHG